jgi:hypothetical protein
MKRLWMVESPELLAALIGVGLAAYAAYGNEVAAIIRLWQFGGLRGTISN